MARENYDILTDATEAILDGNVKAISIGWDKCKQYVYEIAKGDRKDPFAYFRSLYEGVVRAGISTGPWDNDLAQIRQKHARKTNGRSLPDAIRENFKGNNCTMTRWLEMIEDGLTSGELDECERLIDDEIRHAQAVKGALFEAKARMEKG